MAGYQVVAPLVVVRDATGAMHHVYEKGVLPDNSDKEHVKQLLADKMIEKVKDAPAPDPAKDDKPNGNADRASWAAYAKTKGASDEELKEQADGGLSRDELREKYGK